MTDCDLLIRGARLLNVYSGQEEAADLAVHHGRIAGVGPSLAVTAAEVVEAQGLYLAPGLVDAHMHVDTTFLAPSELARILLPRGTTSVVVDNTNNAHTGGPAAVRAMAAGFDGVPLRAFMAAPSYCPLDPGLETAAETLDAALIGELLGGAVAIGETVWSRIAAEDRDYLRLLASLRPRTTRISGHGGEIARGDSVAFDAYATAGIQDDHCIGRPGDIPDRLRRGLALFLVECSGRRGQLPPLLRAMTEGGLPLRRASLCLDNITLADMVGRGYGYQDYLIGLGLAQGLPPVELWRMASLNPAEHYRLSGLIGGLGIGRHADFLLMAGPGAFPPEQVWVGGRQVARRGEMVAGIAPSRFPAAYRQTIRLPDFAPADLVVAADGTHARVRVIDVRDGDAFNDAGEAELPVREGRVQPDPAQDVLPAAMVERYGRGGGIGRGFLRGMGLRRGALATSVTVPSNNIMATGASLSDMEAAIRHVAHLQGGFAVVAGGEVLAEVPLPWGGILADLPWEQVLAALEAAEAVLRDLGSRLTHPLFTLAQTGLATLPDLGLTDRGLIDVRLGRIVSPLISTETEHS